MYRVKGQADFEERLRDPHRTETEQERELCHLQLKVDVLKSGYYAYLKRKDRDADEDLKRKIKVAYKKHNKTP